MNHEHTSKLHRLRTLHLFAGAGGGILADILLGHQPVCAVEIEPYCQQVLHARQKDGFLPWFPIFNDVKTFDGKPWRGLVEVVAGGFPCQDISSAGKGAGISGERSGLWAEMARVVCEVRPRYVFVENSPMLTLRGLGQVLRDLAAMGYDARWCVLGACDAGAPHKRERIWILGYLADADSERMEIGGCDIATSGDGGRGSIDGGNGGGNGGGHIATSADADMGDSLCGRLSQPKPKPVQEWSKNRTIQRPCFTSASWWATEPDLGRVAHGVGNRVDRLKAIGNGQVPACAALAWKILSGMA